MGKETFDQGLAIRKEVLGAEHVERSFAGADGFNRPYQELVTEDRWGAVRGRRKAPADGLAAGLKASRARRSEGCDDRF